MLRKVLILGVILLFIGANNLTFGSSGKTLDKNTFKTTEAEYNNYIVDNEGDGNFTNIQDAIDYASDGDFIFVYSGNYSGNIIINKTLNIIGIDQEYLNGIDTGNPIIFGGEVYIEHVTGVLFSNFTLTGVPDIDKIKIEYSNNSNIMNCSADYLLLYYADENTVRNCEFNTKFDYFTSINLILSSNNIITDNVCIARATEVNFNVGICLQASNNNQLLNNTCTALDSDVKGKVDSSIYISSSNDNSISGNICWQSDIGIKLELSNNNFISGNNITTNKNKGIFLTKCNNNEITQNNFINNPKHASFKKCKNTIWTENYWDDLKSSGSKLITGTIGPFFGLIPWVNYDRHPVKEPYEIMD